MIWREQEGGSSFGRNITIGCDDGGRVQIKWRYMKQDLTRERNDDSFTVSLVCK